MNLDGCKQTKHIHRIATFSGASILISDNEDFSDITNLLHNEYEEDEHWRSNKKDGSSKINICGQEVSQLTRRIKHQVQ